ESELIMSKFERIVRDPEICGGQPTIKGTRVLVTVILDCLKEGISFNDILESYPSITREDIQEIITYAKEMITGEIIVYGSKESEVSTG
ncbi:MAG: DUF433 domain-containing protein, partial [Candidatus Heimdallarchaeota archaeon]